MSKHKKITHNIYSLILFIITVFLLLGSFSTIWAITLPVPDFETFFTKQIAEQSMKIYDRTGETLLYDVKGVRRTPVVFGTIPQVVKNATLAIEDAGFYQHKGIQPTSIARAFLVNLVSGGVAQGGSTITQQVVKNSLLTRDKTITRKIKEVVLSVKLENSMTKDEILNVYLNQSPYGGNIYGVQEAAKAYFHKDIGQITMAEAAYLAALPQAPNYYSPYGANKDKLEQRKNLVLSRMLEVKFITKAEYDKAKAERVTFYEKINQGIKAPHFVTWLKDDLALRYGLDNIENNNFKVISTINWDLQQKVEELAKKHGDENEIKFNAKNNSIVILDPKTGQILAFTGSRDFFNQAIKGNFNVATAYRQPGSSFKPFVYAAAFNKGYTDQTILFDLKTEFNTNCSPTSKPITAGAKCYSPQDYDGKYPGPLTLRQALGQSRNVPAVKLLYLVGINNALDLAKKMGITNLGDKNQYGLTLVLGGGEVSLLDMTGAYGAFAADGIKHTTNGILSITGPNGNKLEEYKDESEEVLPPNTARLVTDILADDNARAPAYGVHSNLWFGNRQVAVKTGTTNDYKDAWVIGYTPNVVVGAWAGNSDNTPMEKKVAGYLLTPLWSAVMKEALAITPNERFVPPVVNYAGIAPVLRGYWQGGEAQNINGQEFLNINVHSILYWIDKNNPLGGKPGNPASDPQFKLWEYPIQQWLKTKPQRLGGVLPMSQPNPDQIRLLNQIEILSPVGENNYPLQNDIKISLILPSNLTINQVDYFIDNNKLTSTKISPFDLAFNPEESQLAKGKHEFKAIIYDQTGNTVTKTTSFTLSQ
jgi:1A family penicillin-binding protein